MVNVINGNLMAMGIDEVRSTTRGFGDSNPINRNNNNGGKATGSRNR
ncbi:MAG: hypothetical protein ABI123_07315 [Ginsengibacter sp.]